MDRDLKVLLERDLEVEDLFEVEDPEELEELEELPSDNELIRAQTQTPLAEETQEWSQFVASCQSIRIEWDELDDVEPPLPDDRTPAARNKVHSAISNPSRMLLSDMSDGDRREVVSSLQSVVEAIVFQFELFNKESILLETKIDSVSQAESSVPLSLPVYAIFDDTKEREVLGGVSLSTEIDITDFVEMPEVNDPEVNEPFLNKISDRIDRQLLLSEEDAEVHSLVQKDRAERAQRKLRRQLMEEEAKRRRLLYSHAVCVNCRTETVFTPFRSSFNVSFVADNRDIAYVP